MGNFLSKLFAPISGIFAGEIFSTELKSALLGALIGGLFTFLGVYFQISKQRIIDNEKQEQSDKNKLLYIHYLIQDSYSFNKKGPEVIITPFSGNYFNLGYLFQFLIPAANSIDVIVKKINQEEYFLASLNQLNDTFLIDVFRLYNKLNAEIEESTHRYDVAHSTLVDEKYEVASARARLISDIKFYANNTDDKNSSSPKRRGIYNKVYTSLSELDSLESTSMVESQLNDSFLIYDKIVNALKEGETREQKILLITAQETQDKDFQFRRRASNIYNSLISNGAAMNQIIDSIRQKAVPLDLYISRISTERE